MEERREEPGQKDIGGIAVPGGSKVPNSSLIRLLRATPRFAASLEWGEELRESRLVEDDTAAALRN